MQCTSIDAPRQLVLLEAVLPGVSEIAREGSWRGGETRASWGRMRCEVPLYVSEQLREAHSTFDHPRLHVVAHGVSLQRGVNRRAGDHRQATGGRVGPDGCQHVR